MREETREIGEKRDRRGERRKERREHDPGPKFPHWCDALGGIIFAMYVSCVCSRARGSIRFWISRTSFQLQPLTVINAFSTAPTWLYVRCP